MLNLVFSISVDKKISLKLICKGIFKNNKQCITFASDSGKIFLGEYNPESYGKELKLEVLNINQKVTHLMPARFDPFTHDILLIATTDSLVAFDVENNKDLFFKDMLDGTSSMAFGKIGTLEENLVFIGCNSSIQGFNYLGNDCFWTVSGDKVSCLTILDYDKDSIEELAVGTENNDIRVFKQDEVIAELSESQVVKALVSLNGNSLGYALVDGTVGVYSQGKRQWRIKSQHTPNVLLAFDVNGDGEQEMVTGWSNGKIEGRCSKTGETLFKESLSDAVVALMPLIGMGSNEVLLACCADGKLYAFASGTDPISTPAAEANKESLKLQKLRTKKLALLKELKNFEEFIKEETIEETSSDPTFCIPNDTDIQTFIYVERTSGIEDPVVDASLELKICTNNETLIKSVIIFAENIFQNDSFCFHPTENYMSSSLAVPLQPFKDEQVLLAIKVFVCGTPRATGYHVFEVTRTLPKFSMYFLLTSSPPPKESASDPSEEPSGKVVLQINERSNRVCLWMNQNFLLPEDLERKTNEDLYCKFLCLRDQGLLVLHCCDNGKLTIKADSMEVAGEIVQDLCAYLGIQHMTSLAHFPLEFELIPSLFKTMKDYQYVAMKMLGEEAEKSEDVLETVVRVEDALIIDDLPQMKRHYMELISLNREMVNTHSILHNNHNNLVATYKRINTLIQKAAKLRCGYARTDVVNGCKKAIQESDDQTFLKVVTNVRLA